MTDSLERYRASSLGELLLSQQTSQAAMDSLLIRWYRLTWIGSS
jgi:hypothetical protein